MLVIRIYLLKVGIVASMIIESHCLFFLFVFNHRKI